jgi:hypothetical protein
MTDTGLFIEEIVLNSVKKLLSGRVNELLGETECPIPPIEFSMYQGGSAVVPAITLSACERSEKERIVRLDAYTLTIAFTVPEHPAGERNCYAYAASVTTVLGTSARGEVLLANPGGMCSYTRAGPGTKVKVSFSLGEGLPWFERFIFYIGDKGIQNTGGRATSGLSGWGCGIYPPGCAKPMRRGTGRPRQFSPIR